MSPTRNPGRIAGLWYLLLCLIGPLRLMYIPGKLFVHGNATATASNIAAHQWLFRLGIVGDLACALILIFLTLAFYRLFKGVDQYLAILVVIFGGVMPALINFVGVVSDAAALTLVRGADFLSVFNQPQRDALAMLFLGVWLAINGFAYIIMSLTGTLFPQYQAKVFLLSQPALFGELAFMLWLVIKGARPPALNTTSPSLAAAYQGIDI